MRKKPAPNPGVMRATYLKTGWLYPPSPLTYRGDCKVRSVVQHDQPKTNLIWLAGVDTLHDPTPIIDDVHKHFSRDFRVRLIDLPLYFTQWVATLPYEKLPIWAHFPTLEKLLERAEEAQARIVVPERNVVYVDFGARRF